MVPTLFVDSMSQPSRAIMMLCKECNIPHNVKQVQIAKLQHKQPEYISKYHPAGKVPAIEDTDDNTSFTLTESTAILRYIAQKYHVEEHWYPSSCTSADTLQQQARINEVLAWWFENLRKGSTYLMRSKFLPTVLPGMNPQDPEFEKTYKEGRATFYRSLKYMENVFLADNRPFLAGSKISIADLIASAELMQCALVEPKENLVNEYPKVLSWLERVRKNVKCFDEIHSTLYFVLRRNKKTPYIEAPPSSSTPKGKSKM